MIIIHKQNNKNSSENPITKVSLSSFLYKKNMRWKIFLIIFSTFLILSLGLWGMKKVIPAYHSMNPLKNNNQANKEQENSIKALEENMLTIPPVEIMSLYNDPLAIPLSGDENETKNQSDLTKNSFQQDGIILDKQSIQREKIIKEQIDQEMKNYQK